MERDRWRETSRECRRERDTRMGAPDHHRGAPRHHRRAAQHSEALPAAAGSVQTLRVGGTGRRWLPDPDRVVVRRAEQQHRPPVVRLRPNGTPNQTMTAR